MARLPKRLVALGLIGAFVAVVAVPASLPARGDAPIAIAVATFENFVGAPYGAVEKMGDALYKAVAASNRYAAKGGGPLQIKPALTGDPLAAAVGEAAKFGADHVLIGNVIEYGGGRVVYALSLYTVDPVKLIRTRAFTQTSPASEAAMSSAFSTDVASLEAPRTPTGTVTGVVGNNMRADLGQVEGFHLGQRFNVVRSGAVIAQAEIDQIEPAYATLEITNVSPNTAPIIGDELVSLETQPAAGPAAVTEPNSFNPIAILFGIAVVLLAVGHHGVPAGGIVIPSPSPGGAFTVSGQITGGTSNNPQFTFTFTQPVSSASQLAIMGGGAADPMTFTTQNPTTPTQPVTAMGGTNFTSGTTLVVIDSNVSIITGETVTFNFAPGQITDVNGDLLAATTIMFDKARKPLSIRGPSTSHPGGGPGSGPKAPSGSGPRAPAHPDRGGTRPEK